MSITHGRRFLTAQEFRSYCSKMKVELSPFNEELELFEKDGILLPIGRIIKPPEYLADRRKLDGHPETYGQTIPYWMELERLVHRDRSQESSQDEEVWHPFDVDFKNGNQFLYRPSEGDFKPWHSFYEHGGGVEHYYHYWQVHQVYAILRHYPVFTKHHWILGRLVGEPEYRLSSLKPRKSEPRISLNGRMNYFDALSFYIEMDLNEYFRTVNPTHSINGHERPGQDQIKRYLGFQKEHANFVYAKYHLNTDGLYEFLCDLIELQDKYREEEKNSLAEGLAEDLFFLGQMLANVTNKSFADISNELDSRGLFWANKFRHLDENLEMEDCVKDYFDRLAKEYNTQFPDHEFSEHEIDSLWIFVFNETLFPLPYSIFNLHKTLNEQRRIKKLSTYSDLKNLTTSLEFFIRQIAASSKDPQFSKLLDDPNKNTLRPLIYQMMEGETWLELFKDENYKKLSHATKPEYFISNMSIILNDKTLDQNQNSRLAKNFLLAEAGRNLTVHSFTFENEFYTELRGQIFKSIIFAILYVWQRARKKAWV